jgi:hypothetical protein
MFHTRSWENATETGKCSFRLLICYCIHVFLYSFRFITVGCMTLITAMYLHLKHPVQDSSVNSHGNHSSGSTGTNWSAAAPWTESVFRCLQKWTYTSRRTFWTLPTFFFTFLRFTLFFLQHYSITRYASMLRGKVIVLVQNHRRNRFSSSQRTIDFLYIIAKLCSWRTVSFCEGKNLLRYSAIWSCHLFRFFSYNMYNVHTKYLR